MVGSSWVADLTARLQGIEVLAVDWPGLWTRCDESVSFAKLVAEATALAGPDTVLVGHSLGGRIALQLACERVPLAGVAALCSPSQLSLNTGAAEASWREAGGRLTHRVAANGMQCSYVLPVRFLDELNEWLRPAECPDIPALLMFGGSDPKASALQWGPLLEGRLSVTVPGSQHNFMDNPTHRADVVGKVTGFVGSLGGTMRA